MPHFWNPCCGFPLKKAVLIIAFLDLIISIVARIGRMALLDFDQLGEEAVNSLNGTFTPEFFALDEKTRLSNLAYEISKNTIQYSASITLLHFYWAFCIGFEIWLCRTLVGAHYKSDTGRCKKWMWGRSLSSLIQCFFLLAAIVTENELKWFDWLLMSANVLRFYAILIVYEFKKELGATGGFEKL